MRKTTSTVLVGLLGAGGAVALSLAVPGVASASGCGTTTLNEHGTPTAWDAPGRFDTSKLTGGETRSKGHNEVVDNGLRVYTDDTSSEAKAAALYPVKNIPLASQTAESNYALVQTVNDATGGKPGYNLVLDINGGDAGGYTVLVFEDRYGGKWHTSKLDDGIDQGLNGAYGVPEGLGYEGLGSIQEFSDANPNAVIQSFGYSLGSGVKGDVTITKVRFGCNDFAFDLANRAPSASLRIDNGGDDDYTTYFLSGVQSTDPDGDTLSYVFTVNGTVVDSGGKSEFLYTFPKGAGTYTVRLTTSDGKVTHSVEQTVTVTPPKDTIGSALPNTGSNVTGIAALGAVVIVGSGAGLVATRRRSSKHTA